jgi:hypothetical protein
MRFNLPSRRLRKYLIPGRLPDVLALIQVLALDEHTHRSEDGLGSELQGSPESARSWVEIAQSHREFFRVSPEGEHQVSLVARHVIPKSESGVRILPPEFAGRLLDAAIDLHDRQVKLAERWVYLIPIWVALVAGLFSLVTRDVGK